jgi:hypothetical protein
MSLNFEELAKRRLEIIHEQSDIILSLREELKCTERKLRRALRGDPTIHTRWEEDTFEVEYAD